VTGVRKRPRVPSVGEQEMASASVSVSQSSGRARRKQNCPTRALD
jgi:hypothetical protein